MQVAGGLPVHENESNYNHANKVCQMALDMIDVVYLVKDPSTGNNLNIRIGNNKSFNFNSIK